MHDGSQIQDNLRSDASNLENHSGRLGNCCDCGRSFLRENSIFWSHVLSCEKCISLTEGKDFVVCLICGEKFRILTRHLRKSHGITKKDYTGQIAADECVKKYSSAGKINGAGHGEAKSSGIRRSPSAIKARSENLSNLNRSEKSRERSSRVARVTSNKPEILHARTIALAKWRSSNPEEFYSKCTMRMHAVKQSYPEKVLFDMLSKHHVGFRKNQRIFDVSFNTISKRRQIDIMDPLLKVVVEFDGPVHFLPIFGAEKLENIRRSDLILNEALTKKGYTVIRVSHSEFQKGKFKESCIAQILSALTEKSTGLILIGEDYGKS